MSDFLDIQLDIGPARAVLAAKDRPFHDLVQLAGLDPSCDFRGANLSGMNLHRADLSGFDFSGADLRGTGFLGARRNKWTQISGATLDTFDADMLERMRRKPEVDIQSFMLACNGAYGKAERLRGRGFEWRDALAAHAGVFVVVSEILKLDEVEGEQELELAVYRMAEAANPGDADILGKFAEFMWNVCGRMEDAERLYIAALAADPKHPSNIGNFAVFMLDVRDNKKEAERLHMTALMAAPKRAVNNANYARLLIILGRETHATEYMTVALNHAGELHDPLRLECWFYRYAVFPERRDQALVEMEKLLKAGVCSPGWDLSGVVKRAKELEHPEPERLDALAAAISRPKGAALPEGLFKE